METTTETIADVLADLMAYERDAFENDTHIECTDLCTWFGQMRTRLVGALKRTPFGGVGSAIVHDALNRGSAYVDDAIDDQTSGEEEGIYDEGKGIMARLEADSALFDLALACLDGPPPATVLLPIGIAAQIVAAAEGVDATGTLKVAAEAITAALDGKLMRRTVVIDVADGCASVSCAQPTPDLTFMFVDLDVDGGDVSTEVRYSGTKWMPANISHEAAAVVPLPEVRTVTADESEA